MIHCDLLYWFTFVLGGVVPQTPYRGFAPGPHWGTSIPRPVLYLVQKNPYIILCCSAADGSRMAKWNRRTVTTILTAVASTPGTIDPCRGLPVSICPNFIASVVHARVTTDAPQRLQQRLDLTQSFIVYYTPLTAGALSDAFV